MKISSNLPQVIFHRLTKTKCHLQLHPVSLIFIKNVRSVPLLLLSWSTTAGRNSVVHLISDCSDRYQSNFSDQE